MRWFKVSEKDYDIRTEQKWIVVTHFFAAVRRQLPNGESVWVLDGRLSSLHSQRACGRIRSARLDHLLSYYRSGAGHVEEIATRYQRTRGTPGTEC